MKVTNCASRVKEELAVAWNRSGQLVHDIGELGTELASIERSAFELIRLARNFKPAPERHGIYTVDPAADTSDPRETLAILKERMRRTAENLERAQDLLKQSRETIRVIAG
jgi:hypothetical protein